jgi:hypothetical protein
MQDILFIPTPIEHKPDKGGWFYVLNPHGEIMPNMVRYNHIASEWNNHQELNLVHWLRPILASEYAKVIARKAQKEMLDFILCANANGIGDEQFFKIELCDGDFYWQTDKDGDQPLGPDEMIKIYERNKQ